MCFIPVTGKFLFTVSDVFSSVLCLLPSVSRRKASVLEPLLCESVVKRESAFVCCFHISTSHKMAH